MATPTSTPPVHRVVDGSVLRSIIPTLTAQRADQIASNLRAAMEEAKIVTPRQQAAFIANTAHETRDFDRMVESLFYSAKRLREIWPSRFKTEAAALSMQHQPERIANIVYANRIGNGGPDSGDGFRYRGRGPMMLTGRANYREAGRALGLPLEEQPEVVAELGVGFRVAAWYWVARGLNDIAETKDLKDVTRKINGGLIGHTERYAKFVRALAVLTGGSTGTTK